VQPGGRLVSIDFWRGFALLTIFVNHVPGHFLSPYTFRNFGFSDAAELFVLLAGISAAFAYLRPAAGGDLLGTTMRVMLRAFHLYVAHLALVVVAVVVVGGFVVLTADSRMLELFHLDLVNLFPLESLVGIGLLSFQPAYLNILPLYVALLVLCPLLLLLARTSIALALGVSAALYLATQLAGLELPVWPGTGRWYFNPFAWQLLFTCGLAIGAVLDRGARPAPSRVLDIVAPAYLVVAMAWAMMGFPVVLDLSPLPAFLWDFDKTNLALPRLLHVLALAYCVSRLPVERWLKARPGLCEPVGLLGRQALPVFCVGTVLSLAAQVTRPGFDGAFLYDLLIVGVGVFVQWLVAWTLEWHRRGLRTGTRPAAAPASAPASVQTTVAGPAG
jgi:hypothetical protein